ncbi:MucR family transcriptional regulator [Microvirga sp. W0021]|uniref:MucR family transcriptional regulator n=1 Tax=Hohaiivirga grylli TaxID=3133970 RepID=A0ABV0BLF6_9HYPH
MLSGSSGKYADSFSGFVPNDDAPAFSAAVAIIISYLQKTDCSEERIAPLLSNIHRAALEALNAENSCQKKFSESLNKSKSIISIEESISDDYLICLENGQKVKSLKRYLRNQFNMTVEQYREKWSLPPDYPVVAPALSRKRSMLAKQVKPHNARLKNRIAKNKRT